ncbi:MAG: tRNA (N6-threonylcarbamoyladenosine(37)-N6)-methyltransferase TrmO [Lachnospiraceae bacterium]
MKIIAKIHTDFPQKFGIPRQSGLVKELEGRIVFEPAYRSPDAVKGLENFDYLWLLWEFDVPDRENWAATVKPPRLGGNTTMGVFATRSPFRPNHIGLSCVRLKKVEITENGPVITVAGADLRDNTPIYDIKPYLAYTDSHPSAKSGFADAVYDYSLEVEFPQELLDIIPKEKQEAIIGVLSQDPRPQYQNDPERKYGVAFAGFDVRFRVKDNILTVVEIDKFT